MSKLKGAVAAVVMLLASPVPARAQAADIDAAACRPDARAAALLVRVQGFKQGTGALRVQVYGSDPAQFVRGGRRVARIDLPVVRRGAMDVCVPLPGPGRYAVAVRHDVDGDGKGGMNDGGGFSRNPSVSLGDALARRMPPYRDVAIEVGRAPVTVDVVLNYWQGLAIKPIRPVAAR